MAYQETTRQSYGSKVKNSFQGILGGIILIIAGTIILWWNEGRAVKASDALKEVQKVYVELPDINTVDPAFEGKVVHATGVAVTADTLRDAAFGIAVNALKLARNVEYYQWIEESESTSKDKLGGATETTTTYTYEPKWCSSPVNSGDFKDPDYKGKNFVWRVIDEIDQQASNVTFGAYRLTDGIVGSISGQEPAYPALDSTMKAALLANVADSTVVVTVMNDQVYIGANPSAPHIGDVRITFTQVTSPKTISMLEKVVNGTFENYIAKNGKSFARVEMGTVSAENMFEHQKSANKVVLWLLRILGALLVIGGFRSLLNFISTVFAVVPFVQKIIGTGIGLVTTIVGIVWSIIVIALAWVAHRPVLAISLLVIAAALIVWLVTRSRKKKISDVAAVLLIGLMLCIGCTSNSNVGDSSTAAYAAVKGPVEIVKVTELYGEGEPVTTVYHYDEKGNVISEEEEFFEGDFDDSDDIIESLSEKNADGRYTKEVYGNDGVPSQIIVYQYNDRGDVVFSESRQADGSLNYTNRSTYDENGHLVSGTNSSPYGESRYTYEYDDQGHQVKTTYSSNGAVFSISEYQYDADGRIPYHKETYPQMNRVNEYYTTYDANGEENGHRCYVTDSEGFRLNDSDSTYTDKKGFRNEIQYNCYDNKPKTLHGTFNKEHFLTHYEYFEGNAANPSLIVDFNYEKDGATLSDVVWKEMSLGQPKNTRTHICSTRYDTFGNWTRRTQGIPYLFDAEYTKFEDLDNFLAETVRKIIYRGEDQGQNYGFEGKAGKAEIRLTYTADDDVLFGNLCIDGNNLRAVGRRENDESLYFVALMQDGKIPWSLTIPAGDGKRAATLYYLEDMDPEETAVTLNPTREDLKTYRFETTSDEVVGIYTYAIPAYFTTGQVDAFRCGDNWEDIHFDIENVWNTNGTPKMATDETTEYLGDQTNFYVYKWNEATETNLEYNIHFYDGFAIIRILRGNPNEFYPIGTTIAGIYAKLPAVG